MQPADYTVVGYYKDNNQPWCAHVKGLYPHDAIRYAVEEMADLNGWSAREDGGDIMVVAVLSGTAHVAREMPEVTPGNSFVPEDIMAQN